MAICNEGISQKNKDIKMNKSIYIYGASGYGKEV